MPCLLAASPQNNLAIDVSAYCARLCFSDGGSQIEQAPASTVSDHVSDHGLHLLVLADRTPKVLRCMAYLRNRQYNLAPRQ